MRKKEREITDRGVLEELLRRCKICRLGLYDGEWPYVVPVNYGYANGSLYVHSSLKGRKMEILRAHPRVCFEVDLDVEVVGGARPCDYTAHYKSIIGFGQAVLLEDEAGKLEGLRAIMRHYGGPTEGFRPEVVPKTAVIRIDIVSMTGKANPPHQDWE
jgi:uncharacterized protein